MADFRKVCLDKKNIKNTLFKRVKIQFLVINKKDFQRKLKVCQTGSDNLVKKYIKLLENPYLI